MANTAQDLTGNNRILGIGIDIGAYEGGVTDIDSWALSGSFEPDATTLSITLDARDTGSLPPLWANTISVETTGDASYSAIQGSGTGPFYILTLFGLSGEGSFTISFDPALATAKGILLESNPTFTADLRSSTASPVHYVDVDNPNPNPTPPYDSWTSAANNLQDALAWAAAGDQIWVAEGTYYPDQGEDRTADDLTATFTLKDGVGLYGGFAGSETLRTERNPATHPTILSGDLLQNDSAALNSTGDNAYHVLYAQSLTPTAILDGFTITAGNADGPNTSDNFGGGLNCVGASPTITNCSFTGNFADLFGGAIRTSSNSSPTLINCSFTGNSATSGGAFYTANAATTLVNCILWNNAQAGDTAVPGASVYVSDVVNYSPTYSHCLIANSGGSASWDPALGTDNGNNLDANPYFVLEVDPLTAPTIAPGDLRLSSGSPAINAGNGLANGTLTDLAGNPRKIGTIDLGAYEGGVGITFAALHPGLDPNGDANGNGISNFVDYAAGGDPTAPDDPTLRPTLVGNQLTFSYRTTANDINLQYKKSTTLLPGYWFEMILDTDYTISNSATDSGRTIETLTLLSPVLDEPTIFFREDFDADEM